MSFKVRIVQADRTIDVPTGATILAAALDAGVAYPFGCRSGNCGACKSDLVTGEVDDGGLFGVRAVRRGESGAA